MLMDVKSNITESFLTRASIVSGSVMDQKALSQFSYQPERMDNLMDARTNSPSLDVRSIGHRRANAGAGLLQLSIGDADLGQSGKNAEMSAHQQASELAKNQNEQLMDSSNLIYRNLTPERDKHTFDTQGSWNVNERMQNHYGNETCASDSFHDNGQNDQGDPDVQTFFLRYAGDNFSFVCKHNKKCEITVSTRTQCKYCRYQKCLQVGMCRRERPAKVELLEGQQLCVVCQDIANGVHFGAITCEGCKKFFRRGLTEHGSYTCKANQQCEINPRTRNSCRYCRYQKCLAAGMSREAIQMGRPSKFKPMNVSSQSTTPPSSDPKSEPFQFMYQTSRPNDQTPPARSLSVNTDDGVSPMKMIKTEPLSPVGLDSFGQSPRMPCLASPALPMVIPQTSPGVSASESMVNILKTISTSQSFLDVQQDAMKLLDVDSLSPGIVIPVSGVTVDSLSPGNVSATFTELNSRNEQQPPNSLSSGLMSSNLMADRQSMEAASVAASLSPHLAVQDCSPLQAVPGMALPSPMSTQVPRQVVTRQVSLPMASSSSMVTQSQYTSSHPGVLSGGIATSFNPVYVQNNKRYITDVNVYNAFIKGALDDKVKLKSKSRRSSSRATSSSSRATSLTSTASRVELTSVDDFFDGDPPLKDRAPTLNALTLTSSGSLSSLKGLTCTGFPSEPSTPALSSPSSPGHLDLPGISELDGIGSITGGNKSDTVDYILFNQLMTPPTVENLEGSKESLSSPQQDIPMSSPGDHQQRSLSPVAAASRVPSAPSSCSVTTAQPAPMPVITTNHQQPVCAGTSTGKQMPATVAPPTGSNISQTTANSMSSASAGNNTTDVIYSQSHFSPILPQKSPAEVSNKSPGSASSASCSSSSSQFGDNGSVYEYVMELSKQVDLIKRHDDSDSEGSEKDNSTRNLLSQDTPNLNFRNFKECWPPNIMPDENIMWTEQHQTDI
ncbi:hypothetical protein LSH36_98g01040 [Paralvinella palmiformis]|uniref:Nuclear receptor domain-containing protein n=1 Tax=Paralvinella palmiformis TaxID=53620 RepID=A0AAD9NBU4_9ANNE|nr:hypothetical protein LSH36_98g01040 [Paralvinella palmiformis]